MLYKDNTAALSMRREPTASVATFADWQARAVAAYQRSEHEEIAALRAELAGRPHRLAMRLACVFHERGVAPDGSAMARARARKRA